MAFSWFVYTALDKREALAIEDRLREALTALFTARPSLLRKGESWGDVTVEEAVPSADDVAELAEAYDREVSDEVLDRLDECRTAFSVERVGARELDPLQVSILKFLIEACTPCLVDWGDMQIVLHEDILIEIDEYPDVGPLGGDVAAEKGDEKAPVVVADTAGIERSQQIERAIEALSEDTFLLRKFTKQVDLMPDFAKAYVKLLTERGAIGDATAAKELGITREKLEPGLKKLHSVATEFAETLDE